MSWRKGAFIFGLLILVIILAFIMNSPPVVRADTICRYTQALTLNTDKILSTSNYTQCFEIKLPNSQSVMTVKLQPQGGKFDLYLAPGPISGSLTLTSRQHKLNFFSIGPSGTSSTYAIRNASEGSYIIAVVPLQTIYSSPILTVSGKINSPSYSSECTGICSHTAAITQGGMLEIGTDPGSQIAFPFKVICPGQIQASFDWHGTANQLTLSLIGPGTGISIQEYAHQTSSSPITVTYQASTTETQKRDNWWAVITNTYGGTANGDIVIDYPNPNTCPQGGAIEGYITFLRINELGTGYGPPDLFMNVEVVVKLDSAPGEAYGFQLRQDKNSIDHQGMLNMLRAAFNQNRRVHLEYDRNATIFRASLLP
jgi:hypothetical protein